MAPPAEPAPAPAEPDPLADPFSHHKPSETRTWTDLSGKYQVEAELVSFNDGVVRLKRSDGRCCRILLGQLSLADQSVVRGHVESIAQVR
ncbi:MAG: hypothetical protein JXB62_19300 [Pirellulales bacterium]|nr:hypothetical protein [Pirellulales bacterium]